MEVKYVRFEKKKGIGRIQFNRPEKPNALNPYVLRDLERAMAFWEEEVDIKVLILKGNEKAFAAGADIENMSKGDISLGLRPVNT